MSTRRGWGWAPVLGALGVLLAWGLALPADARGQEGPATGPRSPVADARVLDRVVEEALENGLGLAGDRLLEERAEAEVWEARSRYLPTISVEGRYSRQSGTVDLGDFVNPVYGTLNQLTGTSDFPTDLSVTLPYAYESRVRLVQPILNERARAGITAANRTLDSQRAQTLASARATAAEAQAALLAVGTARGVRRTWEASLELVSESERVAQRLVDAGSATPADVLRASAERSAVEQSLLDAREREAAAARAFNRLVGRDLDAPVETVPETVLLRDLEVSEEDAIAHALRTREELTAIDASTEAARAGVRAATAGFLPEVSVALDYGFQGQDVTFGRDDDFWMASLVMSWSVFDGGGNAARRSAARADTRRLMVQRQNTEDLVRLEVRQAYRAAVVARDAIATADDRLVAASRTFELVRRRYEEGLAAPVEFLDARTALTEAELNRVVTVHNYAIRWVDLERAAALRDVTSREEGR